MAQRPNELLARPQGVNIAEVMRINRQRHLFMTQKAMASNAENINKNAAYNPK